MLAVIVGGMFGDEGKGKIISYLSIKDDVDVGVRAGVGTNAGHTVVYQNKTYKLRQVPSSFVNHKAKLYVGAGVLVDVEVFLSEVKNFSLEGRVWVDANCTVIEEHHKTKDKNDPHLAKVVGTTGTGNGPAMEDRVRRIAKTCKDVEVLKPYLEDVSLKVNEAIDNNKKVLIEGSQGTFLSLYHGTYPYVTSKDTTASAALSDVGVGPKKVEDVIVVFKSYITRVGGGPLENELSFEEAQKLNLLEYGTVTGRPRRVAPFNLKLAKRAVMLNSATQIAITKIDVLYKEAAKIKNYEKLPKDAKKFIEEVEAELGVPITLIGTGSEAEDIIDLRNTKLKK
jgi:Adenylosuccinate synthase